MRRTTATIALAATLVATALTAAVLPGRADAPRTVSASEQQQSLDYWTPDRMAQAVEIDGQPPATHLEAGGLEPGDAVDLPWRGLSVSSDRVTPQPNPQTSAVTGSAWTGGGKVARTVGKVYFSLPAGDYTCTATSVDSANRSTVVTAGHCVHQRGAYAENWVFVPGSTPTREPYGRWTPAQMYASPQWLASGDINHDYAFVKLAKRNGRTLAGVVGSLPITFAAPAGQNLTSFGYSGAAPYYGSRLVYCQGEVVPDTYAGSNAEGQACNMIAGASGGPRLSTFNGSTGTVTSVNSFTYSSGPSEEMLWAARFDSGAQQLYAQASR